MKHTDVVDLKIFKMKSQGKCQNRWQKCQIVQVALYHLLKVSGPSSLIRLWVTGASEYTFSSFVGEKLLVAYFVGK